MSLPVRRSSEPTPGSAICRQSKHDDPYASRSSTLTSLQPIADAAVLAAVYDELRGHANGQDGISIVETAGGVLSPAPSGSSQADLYRPLRLPTLLVGDYNLGGIGTTISAWESLHIRGYDVSSVALFAEDRYDNHSYLKDYFRERNIETFSVPPPPARNESAEEDLNAMHNYYQQASEHPEVISFTGRFLKDHDKRIKEIRSMPGEADKVIWHPFLQHTERSKDTISAWDSAYGDHFQSYTTKQENEGKPSSNPEQSLLKHAFDGSASWWTQGLGHGNPKLALTAANAAGRYGHVMFGGAVHKPALDLAHTVVEKSGNPRLSKVFYSDNGSTGMEVAVKMALRAAMVKYKPQKPRSLDVRILGLKNSYHGDTIGTMDCSEPSIFNEKVDWYSGRGVWLDFPTVKMRQGQWLVEPFDSAFETRYFDSLTDLLDFSKREQDCELYKKYIHDTLYEKITKEAVSLGALIIEPVLLGAGGMMFADPLYQKCLVEVARSFYAQVADEPAARFDRNSESPVKSKSGNEWDWCGMPVIFDEVFTGLYRLGRFSAASFLGTHPDIVVNAKLLTGGLLPLCTTTASQSIFEAFLSDDKTDALLHGHSYTAHPMGCSVANESLRTLINLDQGGAWKTFKNDWAPRTANPDAHAWSMWSSSFVYSVSYKKQVDNVFALGSVLAITLKDPAGSGYASTAATGLRDKLLAGSGGDNVIHSRVLGNVLYLMSALTTPGETISGIEETVLEALE